MSGAINEVPGYFRINLNVKVDESENYLGYVFKKKDTNGGSGLSSFASHLNGTSHLLNFHYSLDRSLASH